jgi:hypothetical protein
MEAMKRWEYAIAVEEANNWWTLWLQQDSQSLSEAADYLDNFKSDVTMLAYMSREGWELVTDIRLHDGLPRLIFKRRLK